MPILSLNLSGLRALPHGNASDLRICLVRSEEEVAMSILAILGVVLIVIIVIAVL